MVSNKTGPTLVSFSKFCTTVNSEKRVKEAIVLNDLFREVTGFEPVLWGDSIVGYGRYHYRYKTGREGDFLATGFAPRKAKLSVYIMPGYTDFSEILSRLGKHTTGRSCLYINKLSDVDIKVLGELIVAGIADLNRHWPVEPT
ncbi:MAG: DUF1801 domain-containing protein [Pseudoruegeria sp.]